MPTQTVDSLITANKPHLYLLYAGLTLEDYKSTQNIRDKQPLVTKMIEHATHKQLLKIIHQLMKLEIAVESVSPLRAGNRLVGQLILGYMAHLDKEPFRRYYETEIKDDLGAFADYKIPRKIKQLWTVVRDVARNSLSAEQFEQLQKTVFRAYPAFYYQQFIPLPSDQDLLRGVRPVELTRDATLLQKFNAQLDGRIKIPILPEFDLTAKLLMLEQQILSMNWQVSDYYFFKGGVVHGEIRVPHRVHEILKFITKVRQGELLAPDAYALIINKAREGFDAHAHEIPMNPTTAFYQDICAYRLLEASSAKEHASPVLN